MSRFTGDGGLGKSKRPARRHTGGGGAATWPAGPWRPVTPVPISPSPALWAMHFPGPPSSVQPAVIRRPVAQVLTPSLGLSPPCRGQRENSGQSVCASSFLGRPLGSPGQVRRLGLNIQSVKQQARQSRVAGCLAVPGPVPVSARSVSCPGKPSVLGRLGWWVALSPHIPPRLSDNIFAGFCCAAASSLGLLLRLPHFPGDMSVRPSVRPSAQVILLPEARMPLWRVCTKRLLQDGVGELKQEWWWGRGHPYSSTLVLGGTVLSSPPSCPQTLRSRLICRGLNRGPQNTY